MFCKRFKEISWDLKIIIRKLENQERLLEQILGKEVIMMKEVDDLIAMVEATKGIDESTEVAVDEILAYQAKILGQIANTVDPAVVKGLTDKLASYNAALSAKKDALLAAIPAGTPA
jgi:hypothetical protein